MRSNKLPAYFLFVAGTTLFANTVISQTLVPASSNPSNKPKTNSAEWKTPVRVEVRDLKSIEGGLTQSGLTTPNSSLYFYRDKQQRNFLVQHINKNAFVDVSDYMKGTVVEKTLQNRSPLSHPYASLAIAEMERIAGISKSSPAIYMLEPAPAADTIQKLYVVRDLPSEFYNTKEMVAHVRSGQQRINQKAYLKARMFDMFVGDWDRDHNSWIWVPGANGLSPQPLYRENPFRNINSGARNKEVIKLNDEALSMDAHLTNELTLEDWKEVASTLQGELNDDVIQLALQKLPHEIYAISGTSITNNLIAQRNSLQMLSESYFRFLNKEVQIAATDNNDRISVERLVNGDVSIKIRDEKGEIFKRTFNNRETNQIRIFGLGGNDEYTATGNNSGISVLFAGGDGSDSYTDNSAGRRAIVYDTKNSVIGTGIPRLRLSNDTILPRYNFQLFKYDKVSVKPIFFFSNADRFHVGVGITQTKYKWPKTPYAAKHHFNAKYSISQKAPSFTYEGEIMQALGNWNLEPYINYDLIRWTNFYGMGNRSLLIADDRDYNRMRTRELIASVGLTRTVNNRHRFTLAPFFQTVDFVKDEDRFLYKEFLPSLSKELYTTSQYAGVQAQYVYQKINDSLLPTKGITLAVNGDYTNGIAASDAAFGRYGAEVNAYIPLTRQFGFHFKSGAKSLEGNPEFFQYNRVGGTETIRGYERDRFHGETVQYNQAEIRWVKEVSSYLYKGNFGLIGFFDVGRTWMKNEDSKRWHNGYGGGILLSPFKRISVAALYGFSRDGGNFHFDVITPL